jgi:hypothetical protein
MDPQDVSGTIPSENINEGTVEEHLMDTTLTTDFAVDLIKDDKNDDAPLQVTTTITTTIAPSITMPPRRTYATNTAAATAAADTAAATTTTASTTACTTAATIATATYAATTGTDTIETVQQQYPTASGDSDDDTSVEQQRRMEVDDDCDNDEIDGGDETDGDNYATTTGMDTIETVEPQYPTALVDSDDEQQDRMELNNDDDEEAEDEDDVFEAKVLNNSNNMVATLYHLDGSSASVNETLIDQENVQPIVAPTNEETGTYPWAALDGMVGNMAKENSVARVTLAAAARIKFDKVSQEKLDALVAFIQRSNFSLTGQRYTPETIDGITTDRYTYYTSKELQSIVKFLGDASLCLLINKPKLIRAIIPLYKRYLKPMNREYISDVLTYLKVKHNKRTTKEIMINLALKNGFINAFRK